MLSLGTSRRKPWNCTVLPTRRWWAPQGFPPVWKVHADVWDGYSVRDSMCISVHCILPGNIMLAILWKVGREPSTANSLLCNWSIFFLLISVIFYLLKETSLWHCFPSVCISLCVALSVEIYSSYWFNFSLYWWLLAMCQRAFPTQDFHPCCLVVLLFPFFIK